MRIMLVVVLLVFLSWGFLLSAEDESKALAGGDGEVHLRAVLPEGGTQMISEYLLETDPGKFEELKKLRIENHEEFEKQMVAVSQSIRERNRKDLSEIKVLGDKCRETKSDADKAALKAKLEEVYGRRLEMLKRNPVEMEKNFAKLKSNLAGEEKKVQEKVNKRLNEILSNKDGKTDESVKQ